MSESERLQEKILDMAREDEDKFLSYITKIEALHHHLQGIAKTLVALGPFIEAFSKLGKDPDAHSTLSPLCRACAVAENCGKKSHKVERCDDYREWIELCASCAYWEVDSCVAADPCVDGSNHVPRDPLQV